MSGRDGVGRDKRVRVRVPARAPYCPWGELERAIAPIDQAQELLFYCSVRRVLSADASAAAGTGRAAFYTPRVVLCAAG